MVSRSFLNFCACDLESGPCVVPAWKSQTLPWKSHTFLWRSRILLSSQPMRMDLPFYEREIHKAYLKKQLKAYPIGFDELRFCSMFERVRVCSKGVASFLKSKWCGGKIIVPLHVLTADGSETFAIVGMWTWLAWPSHPVLILIETMARIDPGSSGVRLFVAFGTPLSTFRLTVGWWRKCFW